MHRRGRATRLPAGSTLGPAPAASEPAPAGVGPAHLPPGLEGTARVDCTKILAFPPAGKGSQTHHTYIQTGAFTPAKANTLILSLNFLVQMIHTHFTWICPFKNNKSTLCTIKFTTKSEGICRSGQGLPSRSGSGVRQSLSRHLRPTGDQTGGDRL